MREFLLLANDNGLVAASILCAILAVFLLCFVAVQRGRYRAPRPGPRDDFAKMLILFQTMRDLLEQQKELARELNEAIDVKVKYVRERVEAAQVDLTNMRTEVKALRLEIDDHRQATARNRAADPMSAPNSTDELAALVPEPNRDEGGGEDRLRLLALPEEDCEPPSKLDSWVGLDLGNQPDTLTEDDLTDEVFEEPADPESAREAFKSLLSQDPLPRLGREALASTRAAPPSENPNGAARITSAVKGRVFEYSTAGMTISQIAKELGIGKGEVRLILSLRDIQDS